MPVKARTNVAVVYNSQTITSYCDTADLNSTVSEIDVTDLASTGTETLVGTPTWSIALGGFWDSTVDGYLAPDAITPGTKRTASIAFTDAGDTTVTYTWTSNAEIGDYTVTASGPNEALKWSATLRLSGAPSRA